MFDVKDFMVVNLSKKNKRKWQEKRIDKGRRRREEINQRVINEIN